VPNYLYISEYSHISKQGVGVGAGQVPQEPPLAEQKITLAASSTLSATFNVNTRLIRLHADAICSVELGGASVVATTGSQRLAAGVTEYKAIPDKQVISNLAVITNT
jgi:hypothetical protein